MSLLTLLVLVLVAAVIGSLSQVLGGYSHGGFLISAILAFLGAIAGTWLAQVLQPPPIWPLQVGGQELPIIWSIIGATLSAAILPIFVQRAGRRGDLG